MVKILKGSCAGLIVTSESIPPEIIPGCIILGEGKGYSTGFIVLSDVDAYYIPKTTGDLTTVLNQLVTTLTNLSAALTGIQTSLTTNDFGATSAAPVASAVAGITTTLLSLNALILSQR